MKSKFVNNFSLMSKRYLCFVSKPSKFSIPNETKLLSQIRKLKIEVSNPPLYAERRGWIKDRAREVKDLLKILLHQPEGFRSRFELLDQLSHVRQKLSDMNKERKR